MPSDLDTNEVVSPDSVSTSKRVAGSSPTIISLVEELISIRAAGENDWPMWPPFNRCQLVGLSENKSLLSREFSSRKNGKQLWAAKPRKRQPAHGPEVGLAVLRFSR